ncbi:MAG: pyridoxamine 5'-phosphate oxidase family protein [Actinomycetota bacterium]
MTVELMGDAGALESCVGTRPPGFHLKSISYFDEHCQTLLAVSPFAVIGVTLPDGSIRTHAIGGGPGVLQPVGATELPVPSIALGDAPDGAPVGLLSFVPGYRETLRLNGRLRVAETPVVHLEEAFLHCAKALIRSRLWAEPDSTVAAFRGPAGDGPIDLATTEVARFVGACPFLVLSSVDGDGHADVSPKGDPPGLVATALDASTLAIADRPGNRRTDTMHNLVERDAIGVLAMIPGSPWVVEVRGRAGVTDDEGVRSKLEVTGKVPTAAIVVSADEVEMRYEAALDDAGLWDLDRHVDAANLPKSTQVWVDHVKRNDDPGLAATAARKAVNAKVLGRSIDKDYRENLY